MIKETALAVTATAAVALGIAVYQRNPDRVWNRLFAVHAAGGGVWAFLNYMIETAETPTELGLWLRLTHPVVAMVICTVVDFAWTFPERIDYVDTHRRMLLYGIGLFFGMSGAAPNLYHSISITPHAVAVDYGWPFVAFGIFTVVALGYADVVLLRKAIRLEGVQRVQVVWVLIGLAGSHLIASLVIIIIPLVWGTTAYSGWGAAGYIVTLLGMGYAIAKHRLMRPDMALRRLAGAMASASIVLSVGIGLLQTLEPLLVAQGVPMPLAYIVVGLLMGMLILIAHEQVSEWMRRMLTSGNDPAVVQAEAQSNILRTLDADQLGHSLAQAIHDALEPSRVVVYTRSDDSNWLQPRAFIAARDDDTRASPPALPLDHELVRLVADEAGLITRDQVFRFQSLDEARRLSAEMSELDAQTLAPMMWEDELIGLVLVGPKLSGDMYTDEHLRFVADMALQASLALRNAELYAQTAALKEFNERILREMDNAVVVTNPSGRIVVCNRAAERVLGIDARQARGARIEVLPQGIANCIRASLGSGRILSSQQFRIERDGTTVPVACSTSPLAGDGDASQGAVAVISDLTLIEQLDKERQEAERLSLIRLISAGMAHEIRNPLVAIRTFAELAPKRLDDPEFRSNFLTVAQQEIKRIDKLVGDLLTLSKPADVVVEAIPIADICRQVVRSLSGVAEAKNVTINLHTSSLSGHAEGDPSRLHQAIMNVVSNAIEAEPPRGRVEVTATEAHTRDGDVVRIRVHNSGSYIPEEHIEEIFRPFVSRKPEGTGLGLAICQTIIEEHQGQISVHSTPEDGTEFVIELPYESARTPTMPAGERR